MLRGASKTSVYFATSPSSFSVRFIYLCYSHSLELDLLDTELYFYVANL